MKLELKHLSPYLPYGIKTINIDNSEIMQLGGLSGDTAELLQIKGIGSEDEYCRLSSFEEFKPILKPLSFLTKDENFNLYIDLCEELGVVRCEHLLLALQDNLKYAFNLQDLNCLEEFMNKNHFDWKYNLIENGLAKKTEIVKIMGRGELKTGISISAHKFTKSAEEAISKAGGKAITL